MKSRTAELAEQYVALKREARALEAERKRRNVEAEKVAEQLIEAMEADGFAQLKADGASLTVQYDLSHRTINPAAVRDYYEANVEPDSATVNSQKVGSWIRQLPTGEDGLPILPPELREAVQVRQWAKIGMRETG